MIAGTCCRDAVLLPLYSILYRDRSSSRTCMTSQIERSKRHGSTLANAVIPYVVLLLLIQVFTLNSHMHLTYLVVASLRSFLFFAFVRMCSTICGQLTYLQAPLGVRFPPRRTSPCRASATVPSRWAVVSSSTEGGT